MNHHAQFLKRDDTLLLLVDFQTVMLKPCVERERVHQNAAALIDAAAVLGLPVFCSEQNASRLGGFLPDLLARAADPLLFNKVAFGCFENAPLAEALARTGRKTILLAGVETHICIFHTGVQGLGRGFAVHVVGDAVSSASQANRETGLRRLERAGAVVTSTEMAIYELLNRADTPLFKAALPLLKTLPGR